MAYGDFRYPDVVRTFGLTQTAAALFESVTAVDPGPVLSEMLRRGTLIALNANTEKIRSELLVAPVLAEAWARYGGRVSLHSGVALPADPEAGLTGYVDFLMARSPQLPALAPPVLFVGEAKNDNVIDGFGQCVAGMVGVERFNRREGAEEPAIYGCSTTGAIWRFAKLEAGRLTIDVVEYGIQQPERILGILLHILAPARP